MATSIQLETAHAHWERGEAALTEFRHEEAQTELHQGLTLSRADRNTSLEIDCLISLSQSFVQNGDAIASITHATSGLAICKGDLRREAALRLRLGVAHFTLCDYPAALDSYTEASHLAEEIGDLAQSGRALMGLGVVLGDMARLAEALDYFLRSQMLFRQAGDTEGEMQVACNVGACYIEMGRHDEALAIHAEAAQTARTLGDHDLEANARNNRAESLHALGRLTEAEAEFRAAIAVIQHVNSPRDEADSLRRLGTVLADLGRPEEAREALKQGIALAQQAGARKIQAEGHEALARVCADTGDFAEAYSHYQMFHQVERDVFSEEADRRTQTLLARREADAARLETEQHRQQNVELEAINTALQHAGAENQRLLTELRTQAEVLERLAAEDALTGLPNRRSLDESLGRQFALAGRQDSPLCVALLDVDHFKQVNDRFSHQVGDVVLQTVAKLIRRACRASDFVGRWGGEEFALVLPDTDEAGARVVCEAVRAAIEAHPWQEMQAGLAVTASLGVAGRGKVPTHERLLAQADARLYDAKHAGRNCVAG